MITCEIDNDNRITIFKDKKHAFSAKLNKKPDTCPICHHKISPIFLFAFETRIQISEILFVFWKCPNRVCNYPFISQYRVSSSDWHRYLGAKYDKPKMPNLPNLSHNIVNISPSFEKIYTQALAADSQSLDQIAGMGYRKALEFLIKDYAIKLWPKDEESINKQHLSNVINRFEDVPGIRECAEKASWLGNDETHYIRKWEDKDVSDLKRLLEFVMRYIEMEEARKEYVSEMKK